jgi:hypothetical protein
MSMIDFKEALMRLGTDKALDKLKDMLVERHYDKPSSETKRTGSKRTKRDKTDK